MNNDKHWLVRKSTIRKLWIGLYITLVLSVIVEFFITPHERFGAYGVDTSIGFSAWFGFLGCVLMVVFAKLLGYLIKRPDRFYTEQQSSDSKKSNANGRPHA